MIHSDISLLKAASLAKKDDLFILALETSCDDTSAAIVKNGRTVVSNIISSQIDIHNKFGGVVPEVASRKHIEYISGTISECFKQANMNYSDIDAVSATYGPGLVGALLVGLNAAKAMALTLKVPFIGVNHMEGHVCANYVSSQTIEPPFLCLVVSGGHTQIVAVDDYCTYKVIGETMDDAAGEAFDKISRELGLGYPGGPKIQNLALKGDKNSIKFPRSKLKSSEYDFSFSGLKTAVLNYMHNSLQRGDCFIPADVAASFQNAVVTDLCEKSISAALKYKYKKIALAGGVAANSELRGQMSERCQNNGIQLFVPEMIYCTDNAAMIASAAYFKFKIRGKYDSLSLNAKPNLRIGDD